MDEPLASTLQRQIDEIAASVAHHLDLIDDLTAEAEASNQRADAAEHRADMAERRADRMEARADLDRQMIASLQAAGAVDREHADDVEAAIRSSRTVGTAVGILMTSRGINHDDALVVLLGATERTGLAIEQLAQTIVTGTEAAR